MNTIEQIRQLRAQGKTPEEIKALILAGATTSAATTQQQEQRPEPDNTDEETKDGQQCETPTEDTNEAQDQEMNFEDDADSNAQSQEQTNEEPQDGQEQEQQTESQEQQNEPQDEQNESETAEEEQEQEPEDAQDEQQPQDENEQPKEQPQDERPEENEPADPIRVKLERYIKLDIAVYLAGPAGCGKSYAVQKTAEKLGLDFYMDNQIQVSFDVKGYGNASGQFVETEFYRAFTRGGVYFLDEIDSSCPDALVALNNAIANKYFVFPVIGRVQAHPNFRVVAAGNTIGEGANEIYTGRQRLDAATLNRFIIVNCDYNEETENKLGNPELTQFIHGLRGIYNNIGKQAVISYRQIVNITKCELAGEPLRECMHDILFSTESADDWEQIHFQLPSIRGNRYAKEAFKIEIQ